MKTFNAPEIERIYFAVEDVITTSDGGNQSGTVEGGGDGGESGI